MITIQGAPVYYEYHTGGRAVRASACRTKADFTDEIRRQIRRAANHQCMACKGEGIVNIGMPDMKLCRCVPIY